MVAEPEDEEVARQPIGVPLERPELALFVEEIEDASDGGAGDLRGGLAAEAVEQAGDVELALDAGQDKRADGRLEVAELAMDLVEVLPDVAAAAFRFERDLGQEEPRR